MAKNAPSLVAIDDGYAQTKVYGRAPDGDGIVKKVFRTSVRSGRYGLRALGGEGAIDSYRTEEGEEFTVSEQVEAENTQFDGFHVSGMNRAVVNHALVVAGYGGRRVELVTGLPVQDYFAPDGSLSNRIAEKKANLARKVSRVSSDAPMAELASVDVGCQAVAAWFDYTFGDDLKPRQDVKGRVAIVDVGGRTTDIAVVVNGASVDAQLSGTRNTGVLDVYKALNEGIRKRFDIRDEFPLAYLDRAVRTGKLELYGKDEDVADMVQAAVAQVESNIVREIDRRIGGAKATLRAIVFTGGGGALFNRIAGNFPNGAMIEDPEFANARGLFKFAAVRAARSAAA